MRKRRTETSEQRGRGTVFCFLFSVFCSRRASHGIALVEILVAIAILMILATMSFQIYWQTNRIKMLDTDALRVMSHIDGARALTLASKNDSAWGVHIAPTSVTLFEGTTYSSGAASNVELPLSPQVAITSTSLSGGGSDIIFERLTGETLQPGTLILALTSSSTMTRTITIYQTGIVEAR